MAAAPAPTTLQTTGTGAVTFETAPYVAPNLDLGVVSGTGGITLGQTVTVGTGTLRLTTTGGITQIRRQPHGQSTRGLGGHGHQPQSGRQ